jgi:uracil-DNA glycosylase
VDLSKGEIALPFFCDVLHAEATLFEPDVIVTFGRKACQALGAIKVREPFKTRRVFEGTPEHPQLRYVKLCSHAGSVSQYPVVPLLHPSGSANGSRKDFRIENSKFLENCDGSIFTYLIFKALDMAHRDKANSASVSIVSSEKL